MEPNQNQPESLLKNLRQHHIVQVHNILTEPFTWPVARSITQLDPAYRDPVMDKLNLRNEAHPPMKHVTQNITIPSGKTLNLPGDVAQVVAKHLVDEILNREGHKATIGDPALRLEVEKRIIVNIDDLRAKMENRNIAQQLDQQIQDLNKEDGIDSNKEVANATDEPAFPELSTPAPAEKPAKQPLRPVQTTK